MSFTGPKKLIWKWPRIFFHGISSAAPTGLSPALFTSRSTSPAARTTARMLASLPRSRGRYAIPSSLPSRPVARGFLHVPVTSQPFAARACAIARPIPREAPVTSASRFVSVAFFMPGMQEGGERSRGFRVVFL